MAEIPKVTFEEKQGIGPDGKEPSRVVAMIKFGNGDYHAGEAFTPWLALLFAATHWVNHELQKK